MSTELEQAIRQFDEAMQRHETFRQHAEDYRRSCEAFRAMVAGANRRSENAKEQATTGEIDLEAYNPELEDSRQEWREQRMVHESLQQELEVLKAEFANLKRPENDVRALARDVIKLQYEKAQKARNLK